MWSFWIAIVVLIVGSWSERPNKYLWISAYAEAGWGDNVRRYYELLALAKLTGRTLVLPPFTISGPDYKRLRRVDPDKIMKKYPKEKWSNVLRSKVNYQGSKSINIPYSDWMDMQAISKEKFNAVDQKEWIEASMATVDVVLVQPHQDNFLRNQDYWQVCTEGSEPSDLTPKWVSRNEETVRFARPICATKSLYSPNLFLPVPDGGANPVANIAKFLNEKYSDAVTLGLDITKYWVSAFRPSLWNPSPPPEVASTKIRPALRFNQKIHGLVTKFLTDNNIGPYLAVHWRRGDVSVDLSPSYLPQTASWLVKGIKYALSQISPSPPTLNSLVLITDSFYEKELARFNNLCETELNMKVYRHYTGDKSVDVPVDMVLGSRGEVFLGTYPGSFYALFIREERDIIGKNSKFAGWVRDVPTKDEL